MVGRADLHTMELIAVDCIRKKKRCCCHLYQLFKSIAGCPIDKSTITMTGNSPKQNMLYLNFLAKAIRCAKTAWSRKITIGFTVVKN